MSTTIQTQRDELKAQIEALKAQNAELLAAQRAEFRIAVSEKGGISIYGLGRFPVTLYKDQMSKLLDSADQIRSFMVANASKLSVK